MKQENKFQQLAEITSRMVSILEDSQPGLITWTVFFTDCAQQYQATALKIGAVSSTATITDRPSFNELGKKMQALHRTLAAEEFGLASWNESILKQASEISSILAAGGIKMERPKRKLQPKNSI